MDKKQHLKMAKFLATLLDSQFQIGGIKFGIDPIINAIPVVGNFIGFFLSLYIFVIARKLEVSFVDLCTMFLNIIVDFLVGIIPILGVIFDVAYKANIRNLKILEKYAEGKFIEGEILK